MKTLHFDRSRLPNLKLKRQKITEDDFLLLSKYDFKGWNGGNLNLVNTIQLGHWLVNEDKSVIFFPLGGGSFEMPEVYELVVNETKVRIWCGGGGDQAKRFKKKADQSYEITVRVSKILIPTALLHIQDSVKELIVDAFAVKLLSGNYSTLAVEFN